MEEIGRGTRVFEAAPVRGLWTPLETPEEVIALADEGRAEGAIAFVEDAGATFLTLVFDELGAVVCRKGTPLSHIAIVSRETEVPCVIGMTFEQEPEAGTTVEVDCSGNEGIIRA